MDLSIDVHEIQQFARNCQEAAAFVPGELRNAMTRSVIAIEGEAKGLVPVDTGNLRRSITHEVSGGAGLVIGKVGTNVPYGRYVEEGTSPHFPPVAAVAGWAGRKGIEPFLVARAIAKHGTKAKPYLKPALETMRGKIDQEFRQVIPRILTKLGGH